MSGVFRAAMKSDSMIKELKHFLYIFNDDEFVLFLQSKIQNSLLIHEIYPFDNLFPPLDELEIDVKSNNLYKILNPNKFIDTKIIDSIIKSKDTGVLLLDWITVVFSVAQKSNVLIHSIPRTYYIRPRAKWNKKESTMLSFDEYAMQRARELDFTRVFEWHLLYKDTSDDDSVSSTVLVAMIISWTTALSPSICTCFWIYVDNKISKSIYEYKEENKKIKNIIFERMFDIRGLYEKENFIMTCVPFYEVEFGKFINAIFSAEYDFGSYTSYDLDTVLIPRAKNMPSSGDQQLIFNLFVMKPLLFSENLIEHDDEYRAMKEQHAITEPNFIEYPITPYNISFDKRILEALANHEDIDHELETDIPKDYLTKELKNKKVDILENTSIDIIKAKYKDDKFVIKRSLNTKDARDSALLIKKLRALSEHVPDVVAINENYIVMTRVGKSLDTYDFPERITLKQWLSTEENKNKFIVHVSDALTALWKLGFIHGDLGTDVPPDSARTVGDKSAKRNITFDGEKYYVIDYDMKELISTKSISRITLPQLSIVKYTDKDYPGLQAKNIYDLLVK